MSILPALKIIEVIISFLWMFVLIYDYLKNKRVSASFIKHGILILVSVFIMTASLSTSIQFEVWKKDPFSRYILPPSQPIERFYDYAIYRFWLPHVLDLAITLAWAFCLLLLCKYSNRRFLDEKDIYLGFLTSLIVGWPNFIIYIVIVFGMLLTKQAIDYFMLQKKSLIPITPYMIIAAIIVLSLSLYYNDRLGLDKLKLVA